MPIVPPVQPTFSKDWQKSGVWTQLAHWDRGGGMDEIAYGVIMQELERGDSASVLWLLFRVHW